MQRGVDDGFDLARTDRRFAPPPLPDLHDRVEAVLPKASAPVQHGRSADAQSGGDAGVGDAVLRHQESCGPDDYAMRRRRAACPLFKEVEILVVDLQRDCGSIHRRGIASVPLNVKLF